MPSPRPTATASAAACEIAAAPAPGPWTNDGPDIIHDRDGRIIAVLEHDAGDERPAWTDAEMEANGNLIAAAPDMLAALHALRTEAQRGAITAEWVHLFCDRVIAKTEGKA